MERRQSLLNWVLRKYPNTSKTRAKGWILEGRVTVAGAANRKPHELLENPGKSLELLSRHRTSLDPAGGWQILPGVDLLYLDSALAIVNKGPGLLSVPAPNHEWSALTIVREFLAGRLKAQGRTLMPQTYARLQPLRVHRLDQYTSGLFCLAMNPAARAHLIEQARSHRMERVYIAFVEGRAANSQGTWRHWLRLSANQRRQQVLATSQAGGKAGFQEAITHFEVLAEYSLPEGERIISKLRLRLETGLRHQIRIQAAQTGVPLVGDRTYNPSYSGSAGVRTKLPFPRQALHAARLELEHPEQAGQRMNWTAQLPEDLRQLEAALQRQV